MRVFLSRRVGVRRTGALIPPVPGDGGSDFGDNEAALPGVLALIRGQSSQCIRASRIILVTLHRLDVCEMRDRMEVLGCNSSSGACYYELNAWN